MAVIDNRWINDEKLNIRHSWFATISTTTTGFFNQRTEKNFVSLIGAIYQ